MKKIISRIYAERKDLTSIISTSVISLASSFFLMIAFANLLNPNQLGIYQYIISIVSIIASLSLTGSNTAIIRAAAKKEYDFFPIVYRYSLLSFIPSTLIAVIIAVYYWLNTNTYLAVGVAFGTVGALGIQLLLRYNAIFIGTGDFKISNILLKAIAFGPVVILLPLLFLTDNPALLAITYFFSSLICMLVVIKVWNMPAKIRAYITIGRTQAHIIKQHLSFAFHQSVITFVGGMTAHIDKIIIFQMLGAEATALYFIAVSIPDRLRGLLKQFEPYLFSKTTNHEALGSLKNINKKFYFALIVVIPIFIAYLLVAPTFFRLFLEQYQEAILLTLIYGLTLFGSAAIIPISYMKAHGDNVVFYIYTAATTLSKILFVIIGISFGGIVGGIAGATLATVFITLFSLLIIQFKRFLN